MKIASIFIYILSFTSAFTLNAQSKHSLTRREAYFYANRATSWLDANDKNIIQNTELVIMLLETDDSGRVTKIHLMAENRDEKSLYSVLKDMKPDDFNKYQVNYGARKKTVIVPIWSLKYWSDPSNYLDNMRMPSCPFDTEDMSAIISENYGYIHVNGLSHVVQAPPLPEEPVAPKIDPTKPLPFKEEKEKLVYRLADGSKRNPLNKFIRDTLLKEIKRYSIRADHEDSIMRRLQKNNDLIIGFCSHNLDWNNAIYFRLFALKNNTWTAYKYYKKAYYTIGGKHYDFDSFAVEKKYGDSVLNDFIRTRSWELMSYARKNNSECPHVDPAKGWCSISDAETQVLIIMTRNYRNERGFYAPSYYEYECCPGWTERQRYMNTVARIGLFFKGK